MIDEQFLLLSKAHALLFEAAGYTECGPDYLMGDGIHQAIELLEDVLKKYVIQTIEAELG